MDNKQNLSTSSSRPLKVKVSVTLDEDIVREVRRLSDDSYRSLSQYVNLVLCRHLAALEREREPPHKR